MSDSKTCVPPGDGVRGTLPGAGLTRAGILCAGDTWKDIAEKGKLELGFERPRGVPQILRKEEETQTVLKDKRALEAKAHAGANLTGGGGG